MAYQLRILGLCLCHCLFGSAAAGTEARSGSSVDVTQFGYELIDLDPNDSIQPAITFDPRIGSLSMYRYGWGGSGGDIDQISTFGSTSVSSPSGAASTRSSLGGSHAESSFAGPTSVFQEFFGRTEYAMMFELTPRTGIRFTALASVHAEQEGSHVQSSTSAAMLGSLFDMLLEPWSFQDVLSTEGGSETRQLQGYLQTGEVARRGYMSLDTIASSTGMVPAPPPVPEPSTWMMLMGGLGVLGWRSVRSRAPMLKGWRGFRWTRPAAPTGW